MSARDLPEHITRAHALLREVLTAYMLPPEPMTVTEWAEKNRVLSSKDSAEPGPYRADRTPYAKEPQEALSIYSPVKEVVLMWGAQTSKTTVGMNWIGSLIALEPGPIMAVQPTLSLAKRFSRQRIAPMIDESATLKKRVKENKSRDEANTTLLKEFAGGFLSIAGANSAADLRSMPIKHLLLDEVDAYPHDVDGEGDPIALARARQTTFSGAKTLITSTPTIKGQSRIEEAYLATDQRTRHVPCPHCGEKQELEWGADKPYGIKWHKDERGQPLPETAHYVCRHCGAEIAEHHKQTMLPLGEWIPKNPTAPPTLRGYHLSSLYSPIGWLSWADLAREWLAAHAASRAGNYTKLQAFINTRLAETFQVEGRGSSAAALAARAEPYSPGIVPRGGLLLVMGVDTQPDRLEARVWAFGRGEESWLIERHIIYGDPNIEEGQADSPWAKLTKIRQTPIKHEAGGCMVIEVTGIDTGGHNTAAVYIYCRNHTQSSGGVRAFKGSSHPNCPPITKPRQQDVNWRGRTIRGGVNLWQVGTDTIKGLLMGRLNLSNAGAGFVHIPEAYKTTDEFEQMTVERLVPVSINGKQRFRWTCPSGKRNEALDCMVYAYAAACTIGLQQMREASWDRLEQKISPRERGLFDDIGQADQPSQKAQNAPSQEPPHPINPQPAPTPAPAAGAGAAKPFSRDW